MVNDLFAKNFIGREREIETFEQWLANNDPQAPNILFLHSALSEPKEQGGLGKTWLLRRFAEIVEQQGDIAAVRIDFLNVADRDAVTIARRALEQLRTFYPDWTPTHFDYALNAYENFLKQPENGFHQDRLAEIRLALQQDLQVLSSRFTDTRKRIVIFFDTFEVIEQDLSLVTLDNSSSFPDAYGFLNIGFIIAGRHAPALDHANWVEHQGRVQIMPLSPFTQQEMLDYYYNQQVPDWYHSQIAENAQLLLELTRGRPILVSLIADLLSDESAPPLNTLLQIAPQDVEEQLVLHINDFITKSVNLAVLSMAHISHRFNRDLFITIFADLSPQSDFGKVWSKLLKLSFVRRTSNNEEITLHDEMRDLINKYNWPRIEEGEKKGLQRRDLSLIVIDYYQQRIDTTSDPHILQTYKVEQLYHELFVDHQKHWVTFGNLFEEAIQTWQTAYARNLLWEAKKFTSDFSVNQVAELLLYEIRLLRREERYQESLELCEQFPNKVDRNWLAENANTLQFQKGECYRFASRLDDALKCFVEILHLHTIVHPIPARMYAEVLSRIGSIHEQRGDFDEAIKAYEESLSIFKKEDIMRYVDVINRLCLLYCSQGRVEEAHWRSMIALNICRARQKAGQTSIMLPDSLNTVGVVYIYLKDFKEASRHLEEAKEIFERLLSKKGMATVYHSLGHNEMEKGNHYNAKMWFENAYFTSRTVDANIEIESLYKQAQLNIELGDEQTAIDNLKKAIERTQEIHNPYCEVELSLALAAVLDARGECDAAASMYQRANNAAKQEKYYYRLLGYSERRKAHAHYRAQRFKQAFSDFGMYCYRMSQFGYNEYKMAVSETLEHLLALTGEPLSIGWRTLDTFWRANFPKHGQEEKLMQAALDEAHLLVDLVERST